MYQIKKKLQNGDFIIVLDDKGKMFTSKQFAEFIQQKIFFV